MPISILIIIILSVRPIVDIIPCLSYWDLNKLFLLCADLRPGVLASPLGANRANRGTIDRGGGCCCCYAIYRYSGQIFLCRGAVTPILLFITVCGSIVYIFINHRLSILCEIVNITTCDNCVYSRRLRAHKHRLNKVWTSLRPSK